MIWQYTWNICQKTNLGYSVNKTFSNQFLKELFVCALYTCVICGIKDFWGEESTPHPADHFSLIAKPKNMFCFVFLNDSKYPVNLNSSLNSCTKTLFWDIIKSDGKAKVVAHDICVSVYFHSIVFCLDFHQGKLYLRKRGRKWDENKGSGREPSVMEPVPNWSRFNRRHADSGAMAATHGSRYF